MCTTTPVHKKISAAHILRAYHCASWENTSTGCLHHPLFASSRALIDLMPKTLTKSLQNPSKPYFHSRAHRSPQIIAPLLRVLEKSHAACLMHRDIKPENLFLTKGNRLRLGDFGLAMSWTEELPFSRSGTLVCATILHIRMKMH